MNVLNHSELVATRDAIRRRLTHLKDPNRDDFEWEAATALAAADVLKAIRHAEIPGQQSWNSMTTPETESLALEAEAMRAQA